jgi:catechol 2,3-dioxygenase-like lactoylglutathione lyase family enzyme
MSRLQLALNVDDIDVAVDFYSKLFAVEPAKRKPGYANFAVADPPLKLVLIENKAGGDRLNHLGVEVASPAEVRAHEARLADDGVGALEDSGTCCYATQEKVWVDGPDGAWEIYAVVSDAESFAGNQQCGTNSQVCGDAEAGASTSVCCAS